MIKIGNLIWRLKFVPWDDPNLIRDDTGSPTLGMCDLNTRTIYINENLHGAKLREVISHELVHASLFSYGLQLTLDQEELLAQLIGTYGEEIVIITDKIFNKIRDSY